VTWLRRLTCRLFGHRLEMTPTRVMSVHGNWRLFACARCGMARLTDIGPQPGHHNCRCSIDALHEA